jgi:hypothetical protein
MTSLSDFYGLSSAAEEEPQVEPPRDERAELSSDKFDPQHYLSLQLQSKPMRALLQHDNSLVSSRRSLDSEMQTLVYENYAKFISATDTIRKMAANVGGMDEAMQRLRSNMAAISKTSRGIEGQVAPHRDEVDNLLGVSRLLKRLEFLFELPGRLRRSIELGDYEQAVRYYRISSNILQQYKHLKSFDDIRLESEQIITELKKTLRKAVKEGQTNPATPASGLSISTGSTGNAAAPQPLTSEMQMSYTAMLILDLGEPEPAVQNAVEQAAHDKRAAAADAEAQELMRALVEQNRARFTAAMQKAVETAAKQSGQGRKGSVIGTAVPSERRGSLLERKAKEEAEASSSAAAASASAVAPAPPSLLSLLQQFFLTPFILFADTFLSTLVRPYERKRAKMQSMAEENRLSGAGAGASVSGASSLEKATAASMAHLDKNLTLTRRALEGLTSDLFHAYFALARKELVALGTISPSDDASRVILAFTASLKEFYASLSKPVALVPKAGLDDRATELMQHSLLHCVGSVCEKILQHAVQTLNDVHTMCLNFDARKEAGTETGMPSPQDVSSRLRKHVEEGVSLLVVLLSTREYLPESLPFPNFADLAQAHFQQLLGQLLKLIAYRTPRRSEGNVYPPPPQTKLSLAIGEKVAQPHGGVVSSVSAQRDAANTPLFFLYLSQVCTVQESRDIVLCMKFLRKFFPPGGMSGGRARGAPAISAVEAFMTDLMTEAKENAQMLLLRYVERHGYGVTDIVRKQLVSDKQAAPPFSFCFYFLSSAMMLHK